jgi:hypothetical protein
MKLKLGAFLVSGWLAVAAPAMSATILAVDINGYNAGGGQSIGPTATGFQGFEAAEGLFLDPSIDWSNSGAAGLTRVFGAHTVNIRGVAPGSFLGARNRGANAGALSDLTQDFVFAQRDNTVNFGQHFIKITVSGLDAGETYEFTGFAREPFNGGADSFEAWTDRAELGGLDGPGAYMDANFGAGSSYLPGSNPIPFLARGQISGPDSADPLAYAVSFLTTANAGGTVEVYAWADPNSFSGIQGASLLNGFQLADAPDQIPAPATLALLAGGLIGIALRRRTR